jgi:hypothetical protein
VNWPRRSDAAVAAFFAHIAKFAAILTKALTDLEQDEDE